MKQRDDKYGAFLFCPKQYHGCKQKTLNVASSIDQVVAALRPTYEESLESMYINGMLKHASNRW